MFLLLHTESTSYSTTESDFVCCWKREQGIFCNKCILAQISRVGGALAVVVLLHASLVVKVGFASSRVSQVSKSQIPVDFCCLLQCHKIQFLSFDDISGWRFILPGMAGRWCSLVNDLCLEQQQRHQELLFPPAYVSLIFHNAQWLKIIKKVSSLLYLCYLNSNAPDSSI